MKRLFVYLGITFAVTYACEFTLMAFSDTLTLMGASSVSQVVVALVMFVPLIGVAVTCAIFRDKFSLLPVRPNIRGNVKWYLVALFGPAVLSAAGAALFFAVHPESFDASMGYYTDMVVKQAQAAGQAVDGGTARLALFGQMLLAMTLAPFFNMIFAFGEEMGWRGYMMPKLCERVGPKGAVIVGGVIWGLWHAPITAMGHNYGLDYAGFPWLGILAMCCFCTVVGCLLTWLTFKVGSVWPAALAHGALNAVSGASVYFVKGGSYDPFVGPMPVGYIGGAAFIALAVVAYFALDRSFCSFPVKTEPAAPDEVEAS